MLSKKRTLNDIEARTSDMVEEKKTGKKIKSKSMTLTSMGCVKIDKKVKTDEKTDFDSDTVRIYSWNVNGIRPVIKKEAL